MVSGKRVKTGFYSNPHSKADKIGFQGLCTPARPICAKPVESHESLNTLNSRFSGLSRLRSEKIGGLVSIEQVS